MTFPSFHDDLHLYFVTASISGWKHLFLQEAYIKIVLDSLSWLQAQKQILLFAFSIMPSHLHLILKPENGSISDVIQDFGSYTAHEILKLLRENQEHELIEYFHKQRRDSRHQHSIWQDIQAKNIYTMKFLNQKLEYIHNNPVAKDWNLVKDRADYLYSSACFYDKNQPSIIKITDIREWLMISPPPGTAARA